MLDRLKVQRDFYPALRQFIATEAGESYLGDLSFVDGDLSKELLAARSTFRWPLIEDTQEQVRRTS